MRRWSKPALLALAAAATLAALSAPEQRGRELFGRRCSGCHAPDLNKEGPRLRGVYGRPAAGVPDFEYSDALKKSGIGWNEANLDRWLSGPDDMVPGTDMAFQVPEAAERKDLIAYLKSLANQK